MARKRRIVFFTGDRAEYGILAPLIKSVSQGPALEVYLVIAGAHLSVEFGGTINEIDTSCAKKVRRIPLSKDFCDERLELLRSFSVFVKNGAAVLKEFRPDFMVLAGDRYETFAMAVASFYMNIPIAHLCGGDLSQGGHLDDSARHSITKLSHLHFTTNDDSYKRVVALGEEKWRVFNTGSTVIDNIISSEYAMPEELAKEFGINLAKPIILFTQHPVTTEIELAYRQVKESLEALKELNYQTIITYPCNDPGNKEIIRAIKEYAHTPHFLIRKSLGWRHYLGFLRFVSVVAGNSSSGIIEAPIFKVPCVNIGTRQAGRLRAENVIDVSYNKEKIKSAIHKALFDKVFLAKVKKCSNPYGKDGACQKIVKIFKSVPLGKTLLQKKMSF